MTLSSWAFSGLCRRLCAAHLSILAQGTAQLFVAGPPVVSSGVGEHVGKEQLGGRERMPGTAPST